MSASGFSARKFPGVAQEISQRNPQQPRIAMSGEAAGDFDLHLALRFGGFQPRDNILRPIDSNSFASRRNSPRLMTDRRSKSSSN